MKYTANYNLKKPEGTDTVNIDDLNNNADILDTEINSINEQIDTIKTQDDLFREQINKLSAYAVASGTNNYTTSISGITALTEGMSVKIKFINANTGASTLNINGLGAKSIIKGNGSALSSGNIKAGQICNLAYTGLNFQLLGEGGEYGTATASDVLSGKTIGTDSGLVTGTIPSKGTATITPSTSNQTISTGQYLSGTQTILGDVDLISANIKSGANIFGVAGNSNVVDTSAGTASASHILSAYKAYVNGALLTGTMTNRGTLNNTLTTQGQQYTIPNGYHSGSGKVTATFSNLSSENIKSGVNVGGVVGNLIGFPTTGVGGMSLNDNAFGWIGTQEMYANTTSTSRLLCAFRTAQSGSGYNISVTIPAGATVYSLNFTTGNFELVTGTIILSGVRFKTYIFLNPNRVTLTGYCALHYCYSGYFIQ